jgi:hypothetical protein
VRVRGLVALAARQGQELERLNLAVVMVDRIPFLGLVEVVAEPLDLVALVELAARILTRPMGALVEAARVEDHPQ